MKNNWDNLAQQAFQAMKQRKHFQELEERFLNRLKLESSFKTTVGNRFVFLKEERRGAVEYNKIPELVHVDLEQYRKPAVEVWRLNEK